MNGDQGHEQERGVYANLNLLDADPRLVDLKTQYDPNNLFHLNPNIPPRPTA